MNFVFGIDGTGSRITSLQGRNRAYDQAFARSFVRRLIHRDNANQRYIRGPRLLGGGLSAAISGAASFIKQRVTRTRGLNKVLLTGYSRGGAGVVSVAKRLEDDDIEVSAMLLFDAVDRHLFSDAEVIPRNVKNVLHVMRHPSTSSRESFSNDAVLHYSGHTVGRRKYFKCTHGGMGGTPWPTPVGRTPDQFVDEGLYDGATTVTYANDARISWQVWSYVQPFCVTHGFV